MHRHRQRGRPPRSHPMQPSPLERRIESSCRNEIYPRRRPIRMVPHMRRTFRVLLLVLLPIVFLASASAWVISHYRWMEADYFGDFAIGGVSITQDQLGIWLQNTRSREAERWRFVNAPDAS